MSKEKKVDEYSYYDLEILMVILNNHKVSVLLHVLLQIIQELDN